MPTDCPCILGCTNCINELSEASNLIIYPVSHEWEEWVRNDIARSPALGDKLLFHHGDRGVPCRVVKVAICPSSCHTSYLSILPNICICRLRKAKTTQTIPNTSTIRSLYCTPSGGHPAKVTLSRAKNANSPMPTRLPQIPSSQISSELGCLASGSPQSRGRRRGRGSAHSHSPP